MKRALLLIAVPALLVALGFAQTPTASLNTDQSIIQGCLGGSDGNYTIAQDSTGQILKLATGSVDLKAHLGHEVKLMGHKATAALSSGAPDNSLAVTEVTMISEHCSAAAAAPAVIGSTTSETVIASAAVPAAAATASAAAIATTPAVAAAPDATVATPAAAVPSAPATVNAPSEPVTTPAMPAAPTVSTPAEPVTPPAGVAPPAAPAVPPNTTVKASSDIDAIPAVAATHPKRPSAKQRVSPTQAAAATLAAAAKPAEIASTPIAAEATPAETASAPSEQPATTPDAITPKPAAPTRGGSLGILIAFVVLVLGIGALTPLFNRWRKRKLLEKTGAQNLSFTHKSSSEQNESDKPGTPKAA
jgi:hypothetical protein